MHSRALRPMSSFCRLSLSSSSITVNGMTTWCSLNTNSAFGVVQQHVGVEHEVLYTHLVVVAPPIATQRRPVQPAALRTNRFGRTCRASPPNGLPWSSWASGENNSNETHLPRVGIPAPALPGGGPPECLSTSKGRSMRITDVRRLRFSTL